MMKMAQLLLFCLLGWLGVTVACAGQVGDLEDPAEGRAAAGWAAKGRAERPDNGGAESSDEGRVRSFTATQLGVVDVAEVTARWPKFQEYQRKFTEERNLFFSNLDEESSLTPLQQKKFEKLTTRWGGWERLFTREMRRAAEEVAREQSLYFVLTRDGAQYGGVNITPQVIQRLSRR